MSFPGRNMLFVVVVGLLVVPLQATFIPVLNIFRRVGITGNGDLAKALPFLGVWLAHTGYGLPFAIYLLRNYMGGAAARGLRVGLDRRRRPRRPRSSGSALPMSVPAIAALVIFQFLFVWNDLLVALMYIGATNSANLPLTVTLANLVNSLGGGLAVPDGGAPSSRWPCRSSCSSRLQRYFVRGITGGAVKG